MNQKGFTKNFLKLMDQLEKLCCEGINLFGIPTTDTPSIMFSGEGKVGSPLSANVQISPATGNTLVILPSGLFSNGGLSSIFTQNTTGIQLSGNGSLSSPLQSQIKLSASSGNTLVLLSDGLFSFGSGGSASILSVNVQNISTNSQLGLDIIPSGWAILKIIVSETGGIGDAGDISIGSTSNGFDVVNGETVLAGQTISCGVGTDFFSLVSPQNLYISSTAWGSGIVTVYILIAKIN